MTKNDPVTCASCHTLLAREDAFTCSCCKSPIHSSYDNCSIIISTLDAYEDTYRKIYGDFIYIWTLSDHKRYLRKSFILCTHCHYALLENFFDRLPPQDLPLYINFPWETIGGNLLYKQRLQQIEVPNE